MRTSTRLDFNEIRKLAEAELQDMETRRTEILRRFPELNHRDTASAVPTMEIAVTEPKKRRKMSAEARAKIGAAQRARWAAQKRRAKK